jgi:uncharacterized membrane protein HdeD (DUF308 family)
LTKRVASNNSNNDKATSSTWLRYLEVGLGATAIILTVVALTYPGITTKSIIRMVSIALVIIGFERIAIGIALPSPSKSNRLANIGLGPLIIAIAIIVIFIPLSHPVTSIWLGVLALLFNGISKIIQGTRDKEITRWLRGIILGVGTLNIAVSALAMIVPNIGESVLARSVSFTLFITGVQMIASGIGIKKKARQITR